MSGFGKDIRHVFSHEDFDGLSLNLAHPMIVNPKIVDPNINMFRHQHYVNSLHKYFPQYFKKIENSVRDNDQADKIRHSVGCLHCSEVTTASQVLQSS